MNNSTNEIWQKISQAKSIVSLLDSRFDYDTLCANLALKLVTESLGIRHDIYFEGTLPLSAYEKIDSKKLQAIKQDTDPNNINYNEYDLLILLDSGSYRHVKKNGEYELPPDIEKINIDHHESNGYYGDLNYVKHLTSVCSVLYEIFSEAKFEINSELADILMTGIITDSGFFSYINVTSQDFRIAANLKDLGANFYDIIWKFTFNEDYKDMKLKGIVYSNMVVDFEKRLAYIVLSKDLLREHEIDLEQTKIPPADIIKRLQGVDFVFAIKELGDNLYSVSLRSHEKDYDVMKIAQKFGGGGHVMAAGCNIEVKSENPYEYIVDVITKAANR